MYNLTVQCNEFSNSWVFFASSTMSISNIQCMYLFINKFAFKRISALLTHLLCKCVALFDTSVDWSAIFGWRSKTTFSNTCIQKEYTFSGTKWRWKNNGMFSIVCPNAISRPKRFSHRFCAYFINCCDSIVKIILKSHQRDRYQHQPHLNINSQCQISILLDQQSILVTISFTDGTNQFAIFLLLIWIYLQK